jgi:hypothetical protein
LLPSRAPELNPVENIWQYLRANWRLRELTQNPALVIGGLGACPNNTRIELQTQDMVLLNVPVHIL